MYVAIVIAIQIHSKHALFYSYSAFHPLGIPYYTFIFLSLSN